MILDLSCIIVFIFQGLDWLSCDSRLFPSIAVPIVLVEA